MITFTINMIMVNLDVRLIKMLKMNTSSISSQPSPEYDHHHSLHQKHDSDNNPHRKSLEAFALRHCGEKSLSWELWAAFTAVRQEVIHWNLRRRSQSLYLNQCFPHPSLLAVLRPLTKISSPPSRPEPDAKADDEHKGDAHTHEHPHHGLSWQLLIHLDFGSFRKDHFPVAINNITCVEMSSKSSFIRWKETIVKFFRWIHPPCHFKPCTMSPLAESPLSQDVLIHLKRFFL